MDGWDVRISTLDLQYSCILENRTSLNKIGNQWRNRSSKKALRKKKLKVLARIEILKETIHWMGLKIGWIWYDKDQWIFLGKSTELPNMVNMVNRQLTNDIKCYRSIRKEHGKWKGTDYERRRENTTDNFYAVKVNLNIHNA